MRQSLTNANAEAQQTFLALLRGGATVSAAAQALHLHRSTPYRWAQQDATFAAAWRAVQRLQLEEAQARGAAICRADRVRRAARNAELRPFRQQQAAYARSCKRKTW